MGLCYDVVTSYEFEFWFYASRGVVLSLQIHHELHMMNITTIIIFLLPVFNLFYFQVNQEVITSASVDVDDIIRFNLSIGELSVKDHIMEFLPALSMLKNHVRYAIDFGNDAGLFKLNQRDGVSFLHVSKNKRHNLLPGVYYLQISGVPRYAKKELDALEDENDKDYLSGELGKTLHIKLQIDLH